MTGPKLISMILFGALTWVFGFIFTIGLNGAFSAIMTGTIVATLTCVFIWFAGTSQHAFARGFLGLGAVFIIVPVAALMGFGERLAETSLTALETSVALTEEESSALIVSSLLASAGLIFGIFVGLILVLIGGLMHRRKQPETPT